MPFDLVAAAGLDTLKFTHFLRVITRLALSFVLAAIVAFRPWRRFLRQAPRIGIEQAHAQVLIAVSGTLMIAVIEDQLARAFGLVGLGAFIRFRSGIKDPRDAAVMFVMIGIGMACGLGLVPLALVAAGFVAAILIVFDATGRVRPRLMRVVIAVDDPRAALPAVRGAFPAARVLAAPNTNPQPGKVVLEMALGEGADAETILKELEQKGVAGVREVSLDDD